MINGILTNSEVWYSVKKKHLDVLESLDLMLLRKFFKAHSKTAKESFFLECGIVPIRFTIDKRKLMYLRTILRRPVTDMVRKVYKVQKTVKTPDDWGVDIKEVLQKYRIDLTDEQIMETSIYKYEKIVQKAVNAGAIQYLNDKAASHSKSEELMKSDLVREEYLNDPRFTTSDIQLLFQMKTKMLPVKTSFPSMWNNDVSCRTCQSSVQVESQQHLLFCSGLLKWVDVPHGVKYIDIFDHPDKQLRIVKLYRDLLRQQEILLNCAE